MNSNVIKERVRKEKEIKLDFKHNSINNCINHDEIVEKLQDPEKRENVEKCLKEEEKFFLH